MQSTKDMKHRLMNEVITSLTLLQPAHESESESESMFSKTESAYSVL